MSLDSYELVLLNGKIHTMDEADTIASSVTIRAGLIASIDQGNTAFDPNAKVIDLQGRTVIPGLIDNHIHFLRTGLIPGHDMREMETAFSIEEALQVIQARAKEAPRGALLSALGGIHPDQFEENRYPTMAEMDDAAPEHPVYLSISNWGPGATNSLAKKMLEDLGIPVGEDGIVPQGKETVDAWNALAAQHTYEDTMRQTQNQMDFALSKGLTNVFDMGGTIPAGGWLDPATGYNPILELMREDKVPMRVRVFLPVLDTDADLPDLTARLDYTFKEFGNDIVRVVGVGEWLIPNKLQRQQPLPDFYTDSVRAVAERGWIYKQHMVALGEQKAHLDVWEKVNKDVPIADLHWSMDHCYGIDQETINRAIDLGVGMGSHSARYLEGMVQSPGAPPFRMILDSPNLIVGGGSDGARISTMNPWCMLYFAVTGKNHAGVQINEGQSISRKEVVRIWTQPQGWFCKEEKKMGGIEVGKFGDMVVLSDDFFDEQAVPDEKIKKLTSVLTVVGGKVVHDAGVL